MAENKTTSKKGGTKEGPPKSKLGLIGAILLAIGLAWLLWASVLRPSTPQELKDEKDRQETEKTEAARKKKQAGG